MTIEELRQNIIDNGYEEVTIFENSDFADAFIGISEDNRAVYDFDLMVETLVKDEDMSELEAMEFIEYNTIRSLPYIDNPPVIVHKLL